MIRIGLSEEQKRKEIYKYVKENGIKKVIVFSPEKILMDLPELDIPIRQIGHNEIIMYRTFYPLLEEIGKNHLLVANELMRDRNRSCLTYNCYAKYTNQTEHRMAFSYFPIISEKKDIMILIDFINSQRHKGIGISEIDLCEYDIQCVRKNLRLSVEDVPLPSSASEKYEEEKERLFNSLGNRDPNTIPRNLHVWTGRFKKPFLSDAEHYVARNKRFKRRNVTAYKDVQKKNRYTVIDMPCRRLEFNDFLRVSGMEDIKYLSTGFGVDNVYIGELESWIEEVKEIYAETGLYQG